MNKALIKKIWSKILLSSLFLLSLGKNAHGAYTWGGIEPPQSVPTDISGAIMNLIKIIITVPLLVIGLIIYGTCFYYKITKKNINNNLEKLFNFGKKSIIFALITYAIIYVIKFYKVSNMPENISDMVLIIYIIIAVLALIIYIFLFIFLIKHIACYIKSKTENKTDKLKNNNKNDENKTV